MTEPNDAPPERPDRWLRHDLLVVVLGVVCVWFGIDRTRVTDAGLKHLVALSNLNPLSLSNTRVTDAGLEHLKQCDGLRDVRPEWDSGRGRRAE
jgi:hypothetical protein